MFNYADFFTYHPLELDAKLIVPTKKVYEQLGFQLNSLYHDIRSVLINAHREVATVAKQVYEHPVETVINWVDACAVLYAQAQTVVVPLYQQLQVSAQSGKENLIHYAQAWWENPTQVTVSTFKPITDYVSTVANQSTMYWQAFSENPEQFIATACLPLTNYLSLVGNEAEAILISHYYALGELFTVLMAQPSATLQALYHHSLSALLDSYFNIISSLLSIV